MSKEIGGVRSIQRQISRSRRGKPSEADEEVESGDMDHRSHMKGRHLTVSAKQEAKAGFKWTRDVSNLFGLSLCEV